MTTLSWKEILAAVCLFALGYGMAGWLHDCPTPSPEIVTEVEYVDRVKTEVAYVPKETIVYTDAEGNQRTETERTDIDMTIGKQELTVKVNGKEHAIEKTTDEQYVFDKNKLTLTQTSAATLDINVPTIDNTRRWAVGVGYGDDGIAYTLDFPVGKSDTFGGWVYKDDDSHAVGVKIKF